MTPDDLALVIDWAAQEGWNPGLYDAAAFYTADPDGFLLGLLDGEPIAAISAVRYGENFGFIGLYIVKPQWRGQGYGLKVWKAGLDYLAGRTVGLDGVLSQQDNYRRSGFVLAYRNMRFAGITKPLPADDLPAAATLLSLQAIPLTMLLDYDRTCFPESRADFLRAWISQPGTIALGIIQQHLLAYGVARQCRAGWKIGPLFADSRQLARALLSALLQKIPAGEEYFLDIPACNADACELVQEQQMHMVFETARMYLGKPPDTDIRRIYGITSFELG